MTSARAARARLWAEAYFSTLGKYLNNDFNKHTICARRPYTTLLGATRPHFGHNGRSDNRDIYSNYFNKHTSAASPISIWEIDIVITHIISPYPISISRMTIPTWWMTIGLPYRCPISISDHTLALCLLEHDVEPFQT